MEKGRRMFDFANTTAHGFPYLTWEDVERRVCDKCKYAYYGDHTPLDCEYCPIPDTIEIMKEYAKNIDKNYERYLDDRK